jgi:hypothetical protein
MTKKLLNIFTILLITTSINAQAGSGVFQFLNLPTGARQAAFGGTNITLYDNDLNFAFANPALLSEKTHNFLGLNYTNLFNDVNLGSAIYGRNFSDKDFMAFGVHYIDYGTFLKTNEFNQELGTFTAKDIALTAMYCRWLSPRWTAGITMKAIFSFYERYFSSGLGFDIGFSYHNEQALFSAGLVLRNIGFQFNGYNSINPTQKQEILPIDLQIAVSQKLPKAPLRFHLTLHNMQVWDLSYGIGNNTLDKNNGKTKAAAGVDMFFRHTIWAVEILPHKNFYIIASYNHRRQREMAIKDRRSIAGFALGAGFKAHKFNVGFSIVPYQTGSLGYNITFSTNLTDFGIK